MDTGVQGGIMIGRGSGAIVGTVFGAVWLGLGLQAARVLSLWVAFAFAVCCLGLYAGSIFLIRRGRKLQRLSGTSGKWPATMRNGFAWAVAAEIAGCLAVVIICNLLRRYDLIPAGIAMVVGLHFLPLGKVFRTPVYYATGVSIVLWCVASLVLFQGPEMDVASAIGTGSILWLTASYNLIQAREVLAAIPGVAPSIPPDTTS